MGNSRFWGAIHNISNNNAHWSLPSKTLGTSPLCGCHFGQFSSTQGLKSFPEGQPGGSSSGEL